MKKDILDRYPQVKKFLKAEQSMGLPPDTYPRQVKAIELIDSHGGGTEAEKEASMICAALICSPEMLLFAPLQLFDAGYSEEVETALQQLMSTPKGTLLMPAMLAQAKAAAGIAILEEIAGQVKTGRMPKGETPEQALEKLKEAFTQDADAFAYMEAPVLLSRYETARDDAFAALESKIKPAPKKPFNPSQDFDF